MLLTVVRGPKEDFKTSECLFPLSAIFMRESSRKSFIIMIFIKDFKFLFSFISSHTFHSAMTTIHHDQTIEWMENDLGFHQPFLISATDDDNMEPRSIMEFNVTGAIVRSFLRDGETMIIL